MKFLGLLIASVLLAFAGAEDGKPKLQLLIKEDGEEDCHYCNERKISNRCKWDPNSEDCREAKKECLLMCKEDEEDFVRAVELEYQSLEGWSGIDLIHNTSVRFSDVEYASGQALKKCADSGVEVQWAFMANENDEKWKHCIKDDRNAFLVIPYLQNLGCPFKWFSQHHRILFYETCLQSYDIKSIRSKAKTANRRLLKISSAVQYSIKKNAELQIASGSALITSGVFGGLGVILGPATGGLSLAVSALAFASSSVGGVLSFFGDNIVDHIEESKKELKYLKTNYEDFAKLLVLFMESQNNLDSYLNKYDYKASKIPKSIETRYMNLITSGGQIAALPGKTTSLKKFLEFFQKSIGAVFAKNKATDKSLKTVETMAKALKESKDITKTALMQKLNPGRSGLLFKYNKALTEIVKNNPNTMKNVAFIGKISRIGFGIATSFFSMGMGIYNVVLGSQKLKSTFHYDLIQASRMVTYEYDKLIETYNEFVGKTETNSLTLTSTQSIYALKFFAKDGNWDSLSGVKFRFENSEKKKCETVKYSLSNGWNELSTSKELGDCAFFEFDGGNNASMKVQATLLQNSYLADTVTITKFQVETNGNSIPYLEYLPENGSKESILITHAKTKEFNMKKVLGLREIKTHTSNLQYSGTNSRLDVQLKIGDLKPTGWHTLNKAGYWNGRERGDTDRYSGEVLRNIREEIRVKDYLEFYPEGDNFKMELRITSNTEYWDHWRTDLIKLYFRGENDENIIITCHTWNEKGNGKWIGSGEYAFTCTDRTSANPEKSIQKIEAKVCDTSYAGSDSDHIVFKICKKKNWFNNFGKRKQNDDCCATNYFGKSVYRNDKLEIDTLEHDGGEALGQCEGFDMTSSSVYMALENDSADKICFSAFKLFGSGNEGSIEEIPFGSCHFNNIELDNQEVRETYGKDEWISQKDRNAYISCDRMEEKTTMTSFGLHLCDVDDAGTSRANRIGVEIKKDDGSSCKFTIPNMPKYRNKYVTLRGSSLGKCENMLLDQDMRVYFTFSATDALCFDKVILNEEVCKTWTWLESSEFKQSYSYWKDHMTNPIRCDMPSSISTVQRMSIQVCSQEGSGSSDKIKLHLTNTDDETCVTDSLTGLQTGHLVDFDSYSFDKKQKGCHKFRVTEKITMKVINEGNVDMCLQDVRINVASKKGVGKIMVCKLDIFETSKSETIYIEEKDKPAISLLCS